MMRSEHNGHNLEILVFWNRITNPYLNAHLLLSNAKRAHEARSTHAWEEKNMLPKVKLKLKCWVVEVEARRCSAVSGLWRWAMRWGAVSGCCEQSAAQRAMVMVMDEVGQRGWRWRGKVWRLSGRVYWEFHSKLKGVSNGKG